MTTPTLRCRALALLIAGLSCATAADAVPAPGAELRAFAGRHARVVWTQDAGPTACIYSEKPTMLLMGIDSDDGTGERAITGAPGPVFKPLLSADGQRVFFSDNVARTVCMVPFTGGMPKVLLSDAKCEDVWTDPATGVEWIYAKVGLSAHPGEPVNEDSWGGGQCRRFRADDPSVSELIWDKSPFGHFQVSGDGLAAAGAGNNGQGIFLLPNVSFTPTQNGCWPSMAPDGSHRHWVFNGHHRGIHLFAPIEPERTEFSHRELSLAGAPGSPGNAELLHPRWSNDVRFLVMTGPYASFQWGDEAKISNEVAAGVEVYLGRFSADLGGVEQWVQVSRNRRGDYWPDAWIEPEAGAKLAAAPAAPPSAKAKPAGDDTLQFLFTSAASPNQTSQDGGRHLRLCSMALTGSARYGRGAVIDTAGGSARAAYAPQVLAACRSANAISLACTITPAATQRSEPAVIAAIGAPSRKNDLLLLQAAGHAVVRFDPGASLTGGLAVDLGPLDTARAHHVAITIGPGELRCWLDGTALPVAKVGGTAAWTGTVVSFGADAANEHAWLGTVADVTIHSRAIAAEEVAAAAAAAAKMAKAREPAARTVVDAVLAARTPAADPKAIAPYVRCLSLSTYDVTQVVSGTLAAKRIAVLQWSVLDGARVPAYGKLAPGAKRRLVLEAFDDHPEQEAERQTSTVEGADSLPLFYDPTFGAP